MRIHIEVLTEGQPGRQRIATVERIVEQAPCDGIGLPLEEVKGLIGQLQTIVAAEHARETVAANSSCGACGRTFRATCRPPRARSRRRIGNRGRRFEVNDGYSDLM